MEHLVMHDNVGFYFSWDDSGMKVIFLGDARSEEWTPEIHALFDEEVNGFLDIVASKLKLVEWTEDGPEVVPTSYEHRRAVAWEMWMDLPSVAENALHAV